MIHYPRSLNYAGVSSLLRLLRSVSWLASAGLSLLPFALVVSRSSLRLGMLIVEGGVSIALLLEVCGADAAFESSSTSLLSGWSNAGVKVETCVRILFSYRIDLNLVLSGVSLAVGCGSPAPS